MTQCQSDPWPTPCASSGGHGSPPGQEARTFRFSPSISATHLEFVRTRIAADPVAHYTRRLFGPGPVPPGWRRLARELEVALRMVAKASPTRVDVTRVTGRLGGTGREQLMLLAGDPVIVGVLRKANAQVFASCRVCGGRTHRPQCGSDLHGYCPRHAAVRWLLQLSEHDWEPTKARKGGSPAGSPEDGELRLPRALVDIWRAHDRSPAAAAQPVYSDEESAVTLDSFDSAAFVKWIKPLSAALKAIVVEQQRHGAAQ